MRRFFCIILLLSILVATSGCKDKQQTIHVGYKDSIENELLGQLMGIVIEKDTPYKVVYHEYSGRQLALEGIKKKEIMVYPDEAQGLAKEYLEEVPDNQLLDPLNKALKNDSLKVMDHFGYTKNYILAVPKEDEKFKELVTMKGLGKLSGDLHIATTSAFHSMDEGLKAMLDKYSYTFKTTQGYEGELRYNKIKDGEVEVVQGWSTDGYIDSLNLKVLKDDMEFFDDAYVVPVIHSELEDKQGVLDALKKLEGKITEKDIREMQINVIEDKESTSEVAFRYLREKDIIE